MIDNKYGQVSLEFKPDAPADEPCFVFRAQDEFAVEVLRYYADLVFEKTGNLKMDKDINKQADAFDAWPVKKTPD